MSWFYWMAAKKQWKQVWVTPDSSYKEKVAVAIPGGLLFSGTSYPATGRSYMDRTRLVALPNGEVQQTIEYSADNGKSWKAAFDAIYKKKS